MSEQIQKNEACLQGLEKAVDDLKVRLSPVIRQIPECQPKDEPEQAAMACEFEAHMEFVRSFINRIRKEIMSITDQAAV
jgi:hypothetical protein